MCYSKKYSPFGILFATVFAAAALWFFLRAGCAMTRPVVLLAVMSIALLGLAITRPECLRVPHFLWISVGVMLGNVTHKLLLLFLFFLLVLPMGLIMRCFSRDHLELKKRTSESLWKDREFDPKWDDPKISFTNQF
jgi:hypothetical protein